MKNYTLLSFFILLLITSSTVMSAVLFEVKNSDGRVIMEVADDGVRFFNPTAPITQPDTIMVISTNNITANVSSELSRDFDIADAGSTRGRLNENKLLKVSNNAVTTAIDDSAMIWYKQKNAFRVGHVVITDENSVGQASFGSGSKTNASGEFSTAMGNFTKATGITSTALGFGNEASGNFSTALGSGSKASGETSVAMGMATFAYGDYSTAAGHTTTASGNYSTALGNNTVASGQHATALGHTTNASGDNSTAMGEWTYAGLNSTAIGTHAVASGDYSTAFGYYTNSMAPFATALGSHTAAFGAVATSLGENTTAQAYASLVMGRYNLIDGSQTEWNSYDPLFVIGNGYSENNRSNAFEVKKSGVTYIPSLYMTTSSENKKAVMVDAFGKLCVQSGKDNSSSVIEQLQKENQMLKENNRIQDVRIEKLEKMLENVILNKRKSENE